MNLDDFEPHWFAKRQYIYQERNNIGVLTSSLNDWRKIERLFNKTNMLAKKASKTYWTTLKNCLNDSKCKEVWWIEPDGQHVYIYDGNSVGTRYLPKFVEELTPDINRRGYKLSEPERHKINVLESIISTQRRRAYFLFRCFSIAIEKRLNHWFINSNFDENVSKHVVIHNDNRAYSVTVMRSIIESINFIDETFV